MDELKDGSVLEDIVQYIGDRISNERSDRTFETTVIHRIHATLTFIRKNIANFSPVLDQTNALTRLLDGDEQVIEIVLESLQSILDQHDEDPVIPKQPKEKEKENSKRSYDYSTEFNQEIQQLQCKLKALAVRPVERAPEQPKKKKKVKKKVKTPPIVVENEIEQPQPSVKGLIMKSLWDPTFQPNASTKRVAKTITVSTKKRLNDLEKAHAVFSWLQTSLGFDFHFEPHGEIDLYLQKTAGIFRNGVVLCEIAAYVMHRCGGAAVRAKLRPIEDGKVGRLTIKGCCSQPRHKAQCHHNISLALNCLRVFKTISHRYLWNVDDLMSGHHSHLWGLLFDIFTAVAKPKKEKKEKFHLSFKSEPEREKFKSENFNYTFNQSFGISRVKTKHVLQPMQLCGFEEKNLPHITEKQIESVKAWLHQLGFEVSQDRPELLQDPLRNGVLLCQLLELLESRVGILQYHKKTTSVHAARENVTSGLEQLFKLKDKVIPDAYFFHGESILKGNSHVIWGLLWNMMQNYPINAFAFLDRKTPRRNTGYTPLEYRKLEQSVLQWIDSLNLPGNHAVGAMNLTHLKHDLCGGPLLCDLAAHVTNTRIPGINRRPVGPALAMSNIKKALNALRKCPEMSKRFVLNENEILQGNRIVLLGLLEDMHRLYDGLRPRSTFPSENEHPYLGGVSIHEQEQEEEPQPSVLPPTLIGSTTAESTTPAGPFSLDVPAHVWLDDSPPPPLIHISDLSDIVPGKEKTRPHEMKHSRIESAPVRKCSQAEIVLKWLKRLDIPINDVATFLNPRGALIEFRTGLHLCQIVERVELIRSIEGVSHDPKSKASCLHNLRKALHLLKLKKSMPLDHLNREIELYRGNRNCWIPLLIQIRKAYNHHRVNP